MNRLLFKHRPPADDTDIGGLHDFGDEEYCEDCHNMGMWEVAVGEFDFCTNCAYGVACLKENYEEIKADRDRLVLLNYDIVIRFGKESCRNCGGTPVNAQRLCKWCVGDQSEESKK